MRRLCLMTVIALAAAPAVFAQSYRHGRIRHVEEGVSIQRATETGSEEATVNLPLLPGDRVWTDGNGRAEFQFAGGSLIRLDSASKLDYVAHEEGRDDRKVLRLWSGALYLHLRDRGDGPFEFETPGGIVTAANRGIVRIDVDSGETRVSVIEGDAGLDTATQEIRLRAGERAYARHGEDPDGPESFDRTQADEFADWDDSRQERPAYASSQPATLPDDVVPYAGELEGHGAWYYETEVGHVWRPYVAANWQPYSNGRWVWSVFGWTWVPYETWGWAVSHYGRWGYGSSLGWYWIPGASWAPAWVSWAAGGDYVGWCPLGYRDRPVLVYDRYGHGNRGASGFAASRATTVAQTPWIYLRRGDVGARDLTRRRVHLDGGSIQQVRVLEQARLTRDLAVTEAPAVAVARAVPRNSSSRPGMADTVPETRTDLTATVPVVRRRGRPADGRDDAAGVVEGGSLGAVPTGVFSRFGGASSRSEPAPEASARPRGTHPTDVRTGQRRGEDPAEGSAAVTRRRDVEARSPDRPVRQRDAASEAEREVLRPMFRPLSQPRDEGRERAQPRDNGQRSGGEGRRGGGGEARPSGGGREASPRESSPREASPRQAPPPRPEPQAQPRREPPPPPPPAAERRPRRQSDQ